MQKHPSAKGGKTEKHAHNHWEKSVRSNTPPQSMRHEFDLMNCRFDKLLHEHDAQASDIQKKFESPSSKENVERS